MAPVPPNAEPPDILSLDAQALQAGEQVLDSKPAPGPRGFDALQAERREEQLLHDTQEICAKYLQELTLRDEVIGGLRGKVKEACESERASRALVIEKDALLSQLKA